MTIKATKSQLIITVKIETKAGRSEAWKRVWAKLLQPSGVKDNAK